MQTPTLPALHSRFKSSGTNSFFATHSIGDVARSLFLSSLGWILMAFAIYTVYTIVLGRP